MARNTNDTDVMRRTGRDFYENAANLLEEHDQIQSSLTAIREALGTFQSRFAAHDENVQSFNGSLTTASETLESVWESGAANAFEEQFASFKRAMAELSKTLSEIADSGATMSSQIEDVVNVIKQNVQDMAEVCDTTCDKGRRA